MGMVKHYHEFLQQVYSIVTTKISSIKANLVFQMSFKAINNSFGLNGLIFTLLIFGIYSRIIELDVASLSIIKHAMAMKKVMDKV